MDAWVDSATSSLGAFATQTFYKVRMRRVDATHVGFTINSGTETVLTEGAAPAGNGYIAIQLTNGSGGVAPVVNSDVVDFSYIVTR